MPSASKQCAFKPIVAHAKGRSKKMNGALTAALARAVAHGFALPQAFDEPLQLVSIVRVTCSSDSI